MRANPRVSHTSNRFLFVAMFCCSSCNALCIQLSDRNPPREVASRSLFQSLSKYREFHMFSVMQVYRLILNICNHELACFCDDLISGFCQLITLTGDMFHTFETLKVQCVNSLNDLQFNLIQLKGILSCTAHAGYGTPGRPSLPLVGGTARVFQSRPFRCVCNASVVDVYQLA